MTSTLAAVGAGAAVPAPQTGNGRFFTKTLDWILANFPGDGASR